MKKTIIILMLVSLLTVSIAGCFGNFALTRKVYEFNQSVNDKFLQSIVMWAMFIIPVYEFSALIDVVILNLIEFWSGSNPLAMSDECYEQRFFARDDKTYEVETSKNRYDVKEVDNPENSFSLIFKEAESSWYFHGQGKVLKVTEEDAQGLKLFNLEGIALATF